MDGRAFFPEPSNGLTSETLLKNMIVVMNPSDLS